MPILNSYSFFPYGLDHPWKGPRFMPGCHKPVWLLIVVFCLVMDAPARAGNRQLSPDQHLSQELSRHRTNQTAYTRFPALIDSAQPDSARALLNWWIENCPDAPLHYRTELLTSIWDGSFREEAYEQTLFLDIQRLEWVRQRRPLDQPNPFAPPFGVSPALVGYLAAHDRFLLEFADRLVALQTLGSIEHLITRYYADRVHDFFTELRHPGYADSRIRHHFDQLVQKMSVPRHRILGTFVGGWFPDSELERVGGKVELGMLLGVRLDRWRLYVPVSFGLGGLKEPLQLNHAGQLVAATSFRLFSIGGEAAYIVVDGRHLRFDLIGGAGYIGAQWNKPEGDYDGESLHSLGADLGFGVYTPLGPRGDLSLGLEARRRWLDFDTGLGGDDLSGDAWSLRLVFSWAAGNHRGERLQQLGLNRWREEIARKRS